MSSGGYRRFVFSPSTIVLIGSDCTIPLPPHAESELLLRALESKVDEWRMKYELEGRRMMVRC